MEGARLDDGCFHTCGTCLGGGKNYFVTMGGSCCATLLFSSVKVTFMLVVLTFTVVMLTFMLVIVTFVVMTFMSVVMAFMLMTFMIM